MKKVLLYMRVRRGCDHIVKAFRLGTCIERERDFVLAARAANRLRRAFPFSCWRAILLTSFRFRVDRVQKRRRADRITEPTRLHSRSDQCGARSW